MVCGTKNLFLVSPTVVAPALTIVQMLMTMVLALTEHGFAIPRLADRKDKRGVPIRGGQ
jgi:hypothetical protein